MTIQKLLSSFPYVRAKLSEKIPYINISGSKVTHKKALLIFCQDDASTKKIIGLENQVPFYTDTLPQLYDTYTNENKRYKLFIPQINKSIDTNDIQTNICEYVIKQGFKFNASDVKIIRIKKEYQPLNSIILLLKNFDLYYHFLINGMKFGNILYPARPFEEKPLVRFCTTCLNYGHTNKFCLCEKTKCTKCTLVHDDKSPECEQYIAYNAKIVITSVALKHALSI